MKILGTGSALPEAVFTNDDLSKIVDTNDEWIKERTGISQRHLSTGESVATLSADACKKALEAAGKDAQDVELIILATCSPELPIPSESCQVQALIGAQNAVAFDLNAACSGFLFALNTAYSYFASGIYKNALVVGAEVLSKIVDWSDRSTSILFGDGAGAVYVEADANDLNKCDTPDGYYFVQHANGNKGMVLTCGSRELNNPLYKEEVKDKFIWMDGREIFQFAVRQVPLCIEEVLGKASMEKSDVDFYILHQANARIIDGISRRLKEDIAKFPMNVQNVGNMSSAAIPVLLDECLKNGTLKKGNRIVMSGFGAGLTYGASIITL